MSEPTSYYLLQRSTFALDQALVAFHNTKPGSQDRDGEKVKVLKELGAVCAFIEHMTDKGEIVPNELKRAIDLKHKQLEGVYQWPRPQSYLVLV